MTRSASPELTVLFDGGCPLCVREVTFLRGRDRRGAQGISYEEAMGRIHAITASGEVVRDVAVFREAYRLIGLGWLYAPTRWPVVSAVVDWLYGIWAARRLQLTRRPDLYSLCDERQRCRLETRSS
jgi:predicted DCC family thiol-disulfide oxidoreductase YuxK